MIRKFALVPGTIAAVLVVIWITGIAQPLSAQDTASQQPAAQQPAATQPTTQQPAAQQPDNPQSTQEPPFEESTSRRRAKAPVFKKWVFNVGGGASLTSGTTSNFVRGGGGVAAAGAARNYSQFFGLRLDFQFDNLPLRNTALQAASAPGASSHVYSLHLDPIISIPATKLWTGYIVFGPSYYYRSGKLDSSAAMPGAPCTTFFTWWGRCYSGSLPLDGNFLSESVGEFGFNVGGGLARKVRPDVEIYAEFRLMHGSHNHITTDLRPITLGVRW